MNDEQNPRTETEDDDPQIPPDLGEALDALFPVREITQADINELRDAIEKEIEKGGNDGE